MAQNEMRAKPALPERVRSMEGLGIDRELQDRLALEVAILIKKGPVVLVLRRPRPGHVLTLLEGATKDLTVLPRLVGRVSEARELEPRKPEVLTVWLAHYDAVVSLSDVRLQRCLGACGVEVVERVFAEKVDVVSVLAVV